AENLRDYDTLCAAFFLDRIDSGKHGDAVFRIQRTQKQDVVRVHQETIHSGSVFFPERSVIELCVDYGASVSVFETPNPRKTHRILALEKLSERYSTQLLKRFGEIAFKIFGEVFPF